MDDAARMYVRERAEDVRGDGELLVEGQRDSQAWRGEFQGAAETSSVTRM